MRKHINNTTIEVLFCNRYDCLTKPGGDTTQMLKTKEFLEKSYPVSITLALHPDEIAGSSASIIHIFNIRSIKESYQYFLEAKKHGKRIVISTIFWTPWYEHLMLHLNKCGIYNFSFYHKFFYSFYKLFVFMTAKIFNTPLFCTKTYREKIFEMANYSNLLLPNSIEELEHLSRFTNSKLKNYFVVFNAIDTAIFTSKRNRVQPLPPTVICAARIEPLKNQLGLLRALEHDTNIKIILVGKVGSNSSYMKKIDEIATKRGNVKRIETHVSQEELCNLFAQAHVHVLASFSETTGLTSLESLCSGLKIVIGKEGYCPVQTYFSDRINEDVYLCDPFDIRSIRQAVIRALETKTPTKNCDDKFSWENTALQTYNAYESILQ